MSKDWEGESENGEKNKKFKFQMLDRNIHMKL